MYFNEMNLGGGSITALVVKLTEERTSTNKPYVDVHLSDGREEVSAKLWDSTKESSGLQEGKVYDFILKCSLYKENKSFTLVNFTESSDKNSLDFIRKAPEDTEVLFNKILEITDNIEEKSLALLVNTIYVSLKPRLLTWAAAKTHHHNYYGGLLWHTYRMVKTAKEDSAVYSDLDASVAIAACALHDIGKLEEYNTTEMGAADYTLKGTLFGHLLLGYELIRKFILRLKNEGVVFKDNQVTNLLHCIVSHHGEREWGAIVPPATPEAKFVFYQDLRDSQLTVFEETASKIGCGEVTQVLHNRICRLQEDK